MDYIERIAQLSGRMGQELISFQYYAKEGFLYQQVHDELDAGFCARKIIPIKDEFHNLRKSILDERIPLKGICLGSEYSAGREHNAFLLGMLADPRACPELMEAGSHDLAGSMRAECMDAFWRIGRHAWNYAGGISEVLRNDKDTYVQYKAAMALAKTGNPGVACAVYDAIDGLADRIRHEGEEIPPIKHGKDHFDYLRMALRESLITLLKLNKELGKKAAYELLLDVYPVSKQVDYAMRHFSEFSHLTSKRKIIFA
jgi:hypothetical protein